MADLVIEARKLDTEIKHLTTFYMLTNGILLDKLFEIDFHFSDD